MSGPGKETDSSIPVGGGANAQMGTDPVRVINALAALVLITQSDGRCDFANRYWCEYTGLAAAAALEHGWRTAIHPDDLQAIPDWAHASRQSGDVQEIDARVRRADGEYRWFLFRGSSMEEVDGRRRWCWLGSYADESAATDGRLRRFFDILPWQAGFLRSNGVLEFSNKRSLEDFGMTPQQLEQWTRSGIIHVDDHERTGKSLAALLTNGEMFDEQVRMLYPGGVYRWTRARCVPVRDAQGNIVRYVSFQIDVDDLKRAEDLLAAEVSVLEKVARGEPLEQVLGALCRHVEGLCGGSFCGILLVSPDNERFAVVAGSSLPATFNALLSERSVDGCGCDPYSRAVLGKSPIVIGDLADDRRWEGSTWAAMMLSHGYASCWAIPILSGSGEVNGVVAIHQRERIEAGERERDMADRFAKIASIAMERSRAEEARVSAEEALNQARLELAHVARTATLSAMSASITHEVSQPISGILANANTCARMLATDPPNLVGAAETVRRTIRDADRASEVIKRLRAMFAKKAPTMEIVDLNEAVREVIAMSSVELRRGRVILREYLAEGLPTISGDKIQLQQVILNLLLNAVDAMANVEGRPRTLRVETDIEGADRVRLLVRDSGVGLDPGGIDKLFEAFHTTKVHGLGIGLAISRSIIESHKGKLWATANDGPGATFAFSIPCALPAR